MWTHRQHKATREARAIRIALALLLALSLGLLFLHVHTDDGQMPCPQCVLLAGLVLPFIAVVLHVSQEAPALLGARVDSAPRSLQLWSRRLLRGPPSAR